MKVRLGAVWHFSVAVRDPAKSEQFWTTNFDLQEMFRSSEAVALTNDAIIIGFFKGTPHPDTIDHLSFHLDSMRALREALETLKRNGVELEDPGDHVFTSREFVELPKGVCRIRAPLTHALALALPRWRTLATTAIRPCCRIPIPDRAGRP